MDSRFRDDGASVRYLAQGMRRRPRAWVTHLLYVLQNVVHIVNNAGVLNNLTLRAYVANTRAFSSQIMCTLYLLRSDNQPIQPGTPAHWVYMMGAGWGGVPECARASFSVGETGNRVLDAGGAGVESTLGQGTGTFVFNLELLVLALSKITSFSLDNATDEPDRAAARTTGIYGLLDPPRSKGSRSDQLMESSGNMVFQMGSDTPSADPGENRPYVEGHCGDRMDGRAPGRDAL